MRFVLLHGRPAVGKLTVARALAGITGYRVFDNHLIVDAALAVYDFGTAPFVALRDSLWRAAFNQIAVRREPNGVIFTFSAENTVPQRFVDDLVAMLAASRIDLRCVALTCPEPVIEQRIAGPDRHNRRKLTDIDLYRRLRATGAFDSPRMPPPDLTLDTAELSPDQAAERIRDWLRAAA